MIQHTRMRKKEYPETRYFHSVAAIFIFTLELFMMLYDASKGAFQNNCKTFQLLFLKCHFSTAEICMFIAIKTNQILPMFFTFVCIENPAV